MHKAENGDKKAFEEMISMLKPQLYIIAKSRIKDEFVVNEALQETFISLYLHLNRLKYINNVKLWVTKILINNCNRLVKKYKKNNISYDDIGAETFISSSSEYSKLVDELDFFNLIKFLDTEDRTLLTMFYLEDYTSKEMSEILKINESTIRSRIKRARDKIKFERGYENNEGRGKRHNSKKEVR